MSKNYIDGPKLKRVGNYFEESDDPLSDWTVCRDTIRLVFDVPAKAKIIQFRAYRKNASGRCRVKFRSYSPRVKIDSDFADPLNDYLFSWTHAIIMRLLGRRKTWYVECYYWG